MADEATGIQSPKLVEMCVNAACDSKESVQTWRKQIRILERLPAHLAHPLFHRLLHSGLLNPPLLEVFQYCLEEVVLSGDSSISAEWTVYFKSFKYLRILKAVSCKSLTNVALLHIAGLADTLQELDISCCPKITDEGLSHVLALKNLEGLGISETKITANGVQQLCILKNLRYLDMGGLPVTDSSLCVLTSLTRLESLYVWGSKISDQGVLQLKKFPNLQMVNLAWTEVTRIPSLQSLKYLNMAKCTVASIFEGWNGLDVQLEELNLSGTNIQGPLEVIAGIGAHNLLTVNLSSSNFKDVTFLTGLSKVGVLDLSGTMINDAAMDIIRSIGANLKHLDLSGCRITSGGVGAFARHVPSLEQLHLSGTLVDDCVFEYLQFVHALKVLDLSFTNIKGFAKERGRAVDSNSFVNLKDLTFLRILDLRNTPISDDSSQGILCLSELTQLDLRSELLSDFSLQSLSLLKKLVVLSIEGAMLTDLGLLQFMPPPQLKTLSLLDCWLLTRKGISQFSKTHKNISVRHGLITIDSAQKNRNLKQIQNKRSPTLKGTRINVQYISGSQAYSTDERIRYSRSALLKLREQSACTSNTLPPLLSNLEELAGLFKMTSV